MRDPFSPLRAAYNQVYREDDAAVIDKAVGILLRRSKKPDSFMLKVLVRVLEDFAAKIRRGAL